jgi:glycosyltransferase involved in cell wall biosynthesis
MESVAAIIPTLNEAETIAAVIGEIPRDIVSDIIVVDGGSSDRTAEIAADAGARVIFVGPGYGRACAAGAAAADATILVFLDGDGADRSDLMGQLTAPITRGTHDFVIAGRTRDRRQPGSMGWHQTLAGCLAGCVLRLLYGVSYTDMCAYRAIRRDCLEGLGMSEMTYGWNIEMQMKAARSGLRILEIPMPYRRRSGGLSKVTGSATGSVLAGACIIAAFIRVLNTPSDP